ncbi:MAG: hypothetical protein RR235_09425, partial [Oscillospiraceae bacterium]
EGEINPRTYCYWVHNRLLHFRGSWKAFCRSNIGISIHLFKWRVRIYVLQVGQKRERESL